MSFPSLVADRQPEDYYATDPAAVRKLLTVEKFEGVLWEAACGDGRLSKELERSHQVWSSDLVDRGYGYRQDFFHVLYTDANILTNPPYKVVDSWILHGLNLLQPKRKMALLLPIRYLEGKYRRNKIYTQSPPNRIWIFSERLKVFRDGVKTTGNSVAYAWFVWQRPFGDTSLGWI